MNYHYKLNCYEEFYCYVYGVLRMGSFYPELYRSDWRFKRNYGICASFGDSAAGKVLWRLGKKAKKGFAFAAACLGRLVGRRRIVVPVAVQPLVRKRNDLGASLAGRLCSLGCRFLLLDLINRSICKIVDCLEEMYLK